MGHGGRLANPQRLLSPSNCIERAARTAPGTVVGRAIASEDDQFSWCWNWCYNHRIGWWENLQESPIFDGKNHGFPVDFPLNQSSDITDWDNITDISLMWPAWLVTRCWLRFVPRYAMKIHFEVVPLVKLLPVKHQLWLPHPPLALWCP